MDEIHQTALEWDECREALLEEQRHNELVTEWEASISKAHQLSYALLNRTSMGYFHRVGHLLGELMEEYQIPELDPIEE